MELVLWLILIAIGILFMFSYVIKAVKFIKTDKIHDTVKRKKFKTNPTNNSAKKSQ